MKTIRIDILRDGAKLKTVEIPPGIITVGSASGCNIKLPPEGVREKHCELTWDGEKGTIKSIGAGTGIVVNGMMIVGTILSEGDVVKIGPFLFVFSMIEPPKQETIIALPGVEKPENAKESRVTIASIQPEAPPPPIGYPPKAGTETGPPSPYVPSFPTPPIASVNTGPPLPGILGSDLPPIASTSLGPPTPIGEHISASPRDVDTPAPFLPAPNHYPSAVNYPVPETGDFRRPKRHGLRLVLAFLIALIITAGATLLFLNYYGYIDLGIPGFGEEPGKVMKPSAPGTDSNEPVPQPPSISVKVTGVFGGGRTAATVNNIINREKSTLIPVFEGRSPGTLSLETTVDKGGRVVRTKVTGSSYTDAITQSKTTETISRWKFGAASGITIVKIKIVVETPNIRLPNKTGIRSEPVRYFDFYNRDKEITETQIQTQLFLQRYYDGTGQVISERFFRPGGIPTGHARKGTGVYAAHRIDYYYDKSGRMVAKAYFDDKGNPVEDGDLYHKIEWSYNPTGKAVSIVGFDINGKSFPVKEATVPQD